MKKTLTAAVLFLALAAVSPLPAAPPAGVTVYAWTPNLNELINGTAELLDVIGVPSATVRILPILLGAEAFHSPGLSGIDLNAPLVFALGNLSGGAPGFSLGFSTPGGMYLQKIKESLGDFQELEGGRILAFRKTEKIFDQETYAAAGVDEQEDYERFFVEKVSEIFLAPSDGFAWLSSDLDELKLTAGTPLREFDPGFGTALALNADFSNLMAEALKAAEAEPAAAELIKPWVRFADVIETLSFGLTPGKDGVEVVKGLTAEAGSGLEAFIRAQKNSPRQLVACLDPKPYIALDLGIRQPEKLAQWADVAWDLWGQTLQGISKRENDKSVGDALLAALKIMDANRQPMLDSVKNTGDETAASFTFGPKGSFRGISAARVKDPKVFLDATRASLQALTGTLLLAPNFSLEADFSKLETPRRYLGTDIYTVAFKTKQTEELKEAAKNLPAMSAMLSGFTLEYAAYGNVGISCYGTPGEVIIDQVIDRMEGKTPGLKLDPPRESWGMGVLDYSNLLAAWKPDSAPEGVAGIMEKIAALDLSIPFQIYARRGSIGAKAMVPAAKIKAVIDTLGIMGGETSPAAAQAD